MAEKYNQSKLLKNKVPYQVIAEGDGTCFQLTHKCRVQAYDDMVSVQDEMVFASFRCYHCGRELVQLVGEVQSPEDWTK